MILNKDPSSYARIHPVVVATWAPSEVQAFMELALTDIARMATETETLRAALKPFADIPLWRDTYPDAREDNLSARQLLGYIKVADIRAARAALRGE